MDTVESTLWGMATGEAVVDIILGLTEIVPVVLPASAGGVVVAGAWSSIYGVLAFGGPRRSKSCLHQRWRGTRWSRRHVEVPDPSRGVRGSGCG